MWRFVLLKIMKELTEFETKRKRYKTPNLTRKGKYGEATIMIPEALGIYLRHCLVMRSQAEWAQHQGVRQHD